MFPIFHMINSTVCSLILYMSVSSKQLCIHCIVSHNSAKKNWGQEEPLYTPEPSNQGTDPHTYSSHQFMLTCFTLCDPAGSRYTDMPRSIFGTAFATTGAPKHFLNRHLGNVHFSLMSSWATVLMTQSIYPKILSNARKGDGWKDQPSESCLVSPRSSIILLVLYCQECVDLLWQHYKEALRQVGYNYQVLDTGGNQALWFCSYLCYLF